MSKKDDKAPEQVPVPSLPLDPPTTAMATLPGPQGPEPTEPPAKRKRNRRTRAELEKEKRAAAAEGMPEGVSPEDLARCELALSSTFEILSKVVAKKRGAHWQVDKEESATLGKVWTSALAPYLPQIGAAVPWAAAAAVTWTMIQPRLEQDEKLAQETPPNGPKLA